MDIRNSLSFAGQYSSQYQQQPSVNNNIRNNNTLQYNPRNNSSSNNSKIRTQVQYLPRIEENKVGTYTQVKTNVQQQQQQQQRQHQQQQQQQHQYLPQGYRHQTVIKQEQQQQQYQQPVDYKQQLTQRLNNSYPPPSASPQSELKYNILSSPLSPIEYHQQQHRQYPVQTQNSQRSIKAAVVQQVVNKSYPNRTSTEKHPLNANMNINQGNTYISPQQQQSYNAQTVGNYGTSPQQGVVIPSVNQQQQQQQNVLSSSYGSAYSTSPYSPQPKTSYSSSPSQQQQHGSFIQKSLSDSNIINTLNTSLYDKDTYNNQLQYQRNQTDAVQQHQRQQQQQQRQQQQQQQQHQQQYNDSLTNDPSYYPYHKDLLNAADNSDLSAYAVKYNEGVIHQYPTPDYTNPPPNYNEKQIGYVDKNQAYPPDLTSSYSPNQQSPSQNLPPYSQVIQQTPPQQTYGQATRQGNYPPQYNQGYNQITNTQSPASPQLPLQYSSPTQQQDLSPLYLGYRNADLDSPQGSPLPAQPHAVFKTPQATPPMQRRTAPARQLSNEGYKLDSPSNQLLLQDMSLNSPRPRLETVEMNPRLVLPPRSPVPRTKTQHDDQKAMPPPPAPVYQTVLQTSQTLIQQQQQPVANQRLRSGTVEMTDSAPLKAPQNNDTQVNIQLMPPPSSNGVKYTTLNVTAQRSRAGTVEMTDNSLPLPDRRIRSGTVEMTEAAPAQQLDHPSSSYAPKVSGNERIVVVSSYDGKPHPPPPYSTNQQIVYTNQQSKYVNNSQPLPPLPQSPQEVTPTEVIDFQPLKQQQQHQQPVQSQLPPRLQQTQQNSQQTINHKPSVDQRNQQIPSTYYSDQSGQPTSYTSNGQSQSPLQSIPLSQLNQQVKYEAASPQPSEINQQQYSPQENDTGRPHNEYVSPPALLQGNAALKQQYSQQLNNSNQQNIPPPQYATNDGRKYQQQTVNEKLPSSNASDQELERQQKIMQQQYVQRVRQAQLQQQLREIQNEYEENLLIEQDIAQEFLLEQKEIVNPNDIINRPPYSISTSIPAAYIQSQMYQTRQHVPMPGQQQPQPRMMAYPDPTMTSPPYLPPGHPQHQLPPRMQYPNKDGVFPVTGIPLSQYGYQQRMPPQQRQMQPQQQPIVVMPGGGTFSNPGQFAPTSSMGGSRKDPRVPLDPTNNYQRSGSGKPPTPFQKLRKIAEDISSFVDDVVKFKGKKGDHEYKYLEEMLTQQLLLLDKVAANTNDELRNARKSLVKEVQELLEILERRSTNQPD